MPISKKNFDDEGFPKGIGKSFIPVIKFLEENKNEAFTLSEITKAINIGSLQKVYACLKRIEAIGKVEHRGSFWCYKDEEGV